ncbi:MAG: DNA-methyltransferase [Candidatus Dormibacteria bacterium]
MIDNLPLTRVAALVDHPLAAVVPEMRPAEWRTFLEDVRERGVLEPLRLAPDGVTVLDGRHRLRAARELALAAVPTAPALCEPGDESGFMLRAALHRRHLSDDQRAMLAYRLAEAMSAERGRAQRQAAIESRWAKMEDASGTPDTDGPGVGPSVSPPERSREIAARELGVSVHRLRTAQTLAQDAPDLAAQVEPGRLPLGMASAQANRREALAELAASTPAIIPEGGEIWQGDFRELAARIPANSVDLILSDPPYDTAGLALWPEFGRLAERVLKPGAFCLTYCGQLGLPAELQALGQGGELTYWWLVAVAFGGPSPLIRPRNARSAWRPVLIHRKEPTTMAAQLFRDHILDDSQPGKPYHDWQQSLGPARQLVRRFSLPGQLVLDPFAGSGTFPLAALMEGRRALGIELDPSHAEVARRRLAGADRSEAASA